MRSAPTTSADLDDLTGAHLIEDPYPLLAVERRRHPAAWHPSGMLLTFDHATASAALRDRRLGRVWRDREPAEVLAPFNLLHRDQMLETEPPRHTRLRSRAAAAFTRAHVERLRPRVRAIAETLVAATDPAGFDVLAEYAEPLPVLVIAELLGVPPADAPLLRAWSRAIVAMYEPDPSPEAARAAGAAAAEFSAYVVALVGERRARPRDDLVSRLAATDLSDAEVVATVVLLLNAGHEASVNVLGNGLVAALSAGVSIADGPVDQLVEEMLRYDGALQLFDRTALADLEFAGVRVPQGARVAVLLGAADRDPAVFDRPDAFDPTRTPNPHVAFGAGRHFCLGAPLARLEAAEALSALWSAYPRLRLAEDERPRLPSFVLRGFRRVLVRGGTQP